MWKSNLGFRVGDIHWCGQVQPLSSIAVTQVPKTKRAQYCTFTRNWKFIDMSTKCESTLSRRRIVVLQLNAISRKVLQQHHLNSETSTCEIGASSKSNLEVCEGKCILSLQLCTHNRHHLRNTTTQSTLKFKALLFLTFWTVIKVLFFTVISRPSSIHVMPREKTSNQW